MKLRDNKKNSGYCLNKTYWKFCLYSMTFTPGKDYVMVVRESNQSPRSRHIALCMCPLTAEDYGWLGNEPLPQ